MTATETVKCVVLKSESQSEINIVREKKQSNWSLCFLCISKLILQRTTTTTCLDQREKKREEEEGDAFVLS